jgi:1,4-alpha-glucan branching enzyme
MTVLRREYTWGPTFTDEGATTFRLWAPYEDGVKLVLNGQRYPMTRSNEGWYQAEVPGRPVGSEYGFVLSDGSTVPDPASRSQEERSRVARGGDLRDTHRDLHI